MSRIMWIAVCLLTILCTSVPSFAKPGTDKGGKGIQRRQQIRIREQLIPSDAALTDLATSSGRIDFRSKKKSQLKARVLIPVPAPSLGIADAAGLEGADLHLEIQREGVAVADCSLESMGTDDHGTTGQLRLHVKNSGRRDVKGSCLPAETLPAMQMGDRVVVYGVVNSVRVNFLAEQE